MRRPDLVPDCARCDALCCVATSFEASEDFAIDKPAGVPCPHVTQTHRCGIHAERALRGFRGCALYDCHGAGQRVTAAFAGGDREQAERDRAFLAVREVHELLWALTQARALCLPQHHDLHAALTSTIDALDELAAIPPSALATLDPTPHRATSRALLGRVGEALGGRKRVALALGVLGSRERAPASGEQPRRSFAV